MTWSHLDPDKPHLAYLIIGGFTSLFMLCSLFVKEKLYIGEATVAAICGIIFGPRAANLINPFTWGNTDKITLECSRIVLVVQCFAVGVELPKAYMERHWRSVTLLLVPVMTFGWLITSVFVWWMIEPLSWLESLTIAACVTATDPVLASSVVGKGKFAKRVPKHLRDLLSAESGCNDGMAFPFIYLSLYLIRYNSDAKETIFHWFCYTFLYECIFGAVFGFLVGYSGRHAIKAADRHGLIDRESFLVFYFVLALFCAGSGSILGLDDLLVGFAAGVGFSNDGWFTQKTEEAHVSNVIDLLLNLAYFVYFGSVVPWEQFNNLDIGLEPWRLVVIAILVIFFRRIPIMLALKPFIPDIKNWREALFAGHFGPIGVGAVFVAILARAELENNLEGPQPTFGLPGPGSPNYLIIRLIWPVVSFLVVASIIVHGSSIAVFTLGKRINTLTLTMSYTQGNDSNWLNRLPRIASTSKTMSKSKGDYDSTDDLDEKLQFPPGTLPPIGMPGSFLRRQKEEENPSRSNSRASSMLPTNRKKKRESGNRPGGPISQSAIMPLRRADQPTSPTSQMSPTSPTSPESFFPPGSPDKTKLPYEGDEGKRSRRDSPEIEIFQEGEHMIVEDEEGNVLADENIAGETDAEIKNNIRKDRDALRAETSGEHAKSKHHPHAKNEGEEFEHALAKGLPQSSSNKYKNLKKRVGEWHDRRRKDVKLKPDEERLRGPAHAYQYGNTIIVEDGDGEVVRKYDIPAGERKKSKAGPGEETRMGGLRRMSTWAAGLSVSGPSGAPADAEAGESSEQNKKKSLADKLEEDERIRFTIGSGGRRMSKQDFIKQIQSLDPKARVEAIEEADAPEPMKRAVKRDASKLAEREAAAKELKPSTGEASSSSGTSPGPRAELHIPHPEEDRPVGDTGMTLVDSNDKDIPVHSVSESISRYSMGQPETAAQRRRRLASTPRGRGGNDSDDDGSPRSPPMNSRRGGGGGEPSSSTTRADASPANRDDEGETAAERRRRLAALGEGAAGEDSDSETDEEDGEERKPKHGRVPVAEPDQEPVAVRGTAGVRFADSPAPSQGRVQWGEDVVRGRRGLGRKG